MSNPYESPREPGSTPFSAAPGEDREKLRRVARYQRWALFALLANILLNIATLAIPRNDLITKLAVGAFALVVVLAAVVSVALLANELINVAIAVLCALLMFIP